MSDKQDDVVTGVTEPGGRAADMTAPDVQVAEVTEPDGRVTDETTPGDQVPGSVVPVDEAAPPTSGPAQLRLRRAPGYRAFGLTGALIGVVLGLALALSFTAASNYSMQTIAGYFAAILGLTGAVIGLGLAVLIERRRS